VFVHLVECLVFRVREQGLRRAQNRSLLHEAWDKGPTLKSRILGPIVTQLSDYKDRHYLRLRFSLRFCAWFRHKHLKRGLVAISAFTFRFVFGYVLRFTSRLIGRGLLLVFVAFVFTSLISTHVIWFYGEIIFAS
jgi:hypothetical protein